MKQEQAVFLILFALGVGLIGGLKFLSPLVAPFLLGITLACLIEPLVLKLEQCWHFRRNFAAGFILIFFLILCFGITYLVLNSAYCEAQRLIPDIPKFVSRIVSTSQDFLKRLAFQFRFPDAGLQKFTLNQESLGQLFRSIMLGCSKVLSQLPQIFFSLAFGGFAAYFFSRDKQLIQGVFYRNIPYRWRRSFFQVKDEILTGLSRYLRVESGLACCTASLATIIFFCSHIPGAVAYGFLTGVVDLLPVIGAGSVFLPMIVVLITFGNYSQALWLLIGYFGVVLVRQLVEMRWMGTHLKIHPLLAMFMIYLGMKIFGLAGIIFGPIIVIIMRASYRVLMNSTYEIRKV